ncbi:phosphotransferase family protein [Tateyamaria sp. ANG-S1]|uniref:phosphotransferase family protein n=1 Tax=Tateyamaria sp. ANG-S1 TaxID=1577905 RepID=UPI00057E56E8|nr:phosphotransferase family protein [Tateyamaria sp. ANG-S1]KIC48815.1 aminoglycoside phosphotransferase [Tateyamaria sp. ANG-S1]
MDTQTLDTVAVAHFLRDKLPGFDTAITATKFTGGQSNPTFLLETGAGNYVLRRKPPGQLLKSAHAVDREFRVQKALHGSEVPVAKMHVLCEDASVIGSDFYVMDHVKGRNFNEPTMEGLTNADRTAVISDMNRVLAALHDVDVDAVGLSDYGPPGHYLERQIGRWTKQYRASETQDIPAMNSLIERLAADMPEDDGQRTLVHGDYRIDNMIFEAEGTRCLAVLDWELSTIGHPNADLASVIMQWQLPAGSEGRGLMGVDRGGLGLPTDAEFVAEYCQRRGLERVDRFGFFVAFCFFRMGAIIQGVLKRALDGNASNPKRAMQLGAFVSVFAENGLKALENDV